MVSSGTPLKPYGSAVQKEGGIGRQARSRAAAAAASSANLPWVAAILTPGCCNGWMTSQRFL